MANFFEDVSSLASKTANFFLNPAQTLANVGQSVATSATPVVSKTVNDLAEAFPPVQIYAKAKAQGRSYWDVLQEQMKNDKNYQVLTSQLDYINKGKDVQTAKDLALRDHLSNQVAGNAVLIGGSQEAKPIIKAVENDLSGEVGKAVDYVDELVSSQLKARGAEKPTITQKVGDLFNLLKVKLVDSTAPIEDTLKQYFKSNPVEDVKFNPKFDITGAIDRTYRAPTLASQFAKESGLADVIKGVDNIDAFDQYLIAKHAPEVEAQGFATGRDAARDSQLVGALKDRYEPFAQKVYDYSGKLLDYAVDSGLVSKDTATALRETYPNYVPLKRIFSEAEQEGMSVSGGSGAVASLSKQSVVQKLVGSERQVESPLASLLDSTVNAFTQGEKNKAGRILSNFSELSGNPLELTPLRTAANVKERIDLLDQLSSSFKEARSTTRSGNTISRAIRDTTKEFEKFAEEARVRAADFTDTSGINNLIRKAVTRERQLYSLGMDSEKQATLLAEHKSDIEQLKGLLSDVSDKTKEAGKGTFSFLNDGIKEIWQTKPEIAAAAKSLNVEQMNILGKILAFPVRLARLGITGLNPAFLAANVVKDQLTSFVLSDEVAKTSLANPSVFLKSLFSAVSHDGLYDEVVRNGAGGTSFDIGRNQAKETIDSLRSSSSVVGRAKYLVTHPGELLRAVEDIMGRSEEFTRIQQYQGTKQALMGRGLTEEQATTGAANAARNNSVNFYRRGDWGAVMNNAVLYLNAGIQGGRALLGALEKAPVATSAKIASTVFLPAAAFTLWNLSDPKRKQAYMDIQEYEKQNNFIIVPPNPTQDAHGQWNVIKIPIPQELAGLTAPVRKGIEAAEGVDKFQFGAVANQMLSTVSPVNLSKGGLASGITPQIVKPFLQSYTNTNFFTGNPIVPDSLSKLSAENQAKPDTSGTARLIGRVFNTSPLKVEDFIKTAGGGLASQGLYFTDRALAGLKVFPSNQIGGQSTLDAIISRFASASGGAGSNQQNDALKGIIQNQNDKSFLLKQQAESIYQELKNVPPDIANKKAAELSKTNPTLFAALKTVVTQDKLGLTYTDRLYTQLGVTNGERAKFIWQNLKALPNKDAKNAYVQDLVKKKIISAEVMSQLGQLKAKGY